jgi:Fe2+ or Zn2+ uptake regulation protein
MSNTGECPSCGCSQPQSLLCSEDTGKLQAMLAAAPALLDQLEVAISKQAKVGGGAGKAGKGSAHERSPINWGAVDVRDALRIQVLLLADMPIDAVRRHPQAAGILSGVGKCVKNAYRAIDRMQDRQYLGQCMFEEDGATCHAELWARPGAHQVVCTQCEITHDVQDRRGWLLKQAQDLIVTPREASRYIGEIGHIKVTEASIRGYIHRKRLAYRPPVDAKMIRLGDLLALVMDESDKAERKGAA